jgi:uncharacterized protein (DUF2164 family)
MKENKYFEFESELKKQEFLKEIIGFFETERNEEIGIIAAEEVSNFFLDSLGKEIYNKGLKDARASIHEKIEEFDANVEFVIEKNSK